MIFDHTYRIETTLTILLTTGVNSYLTKQSAYACS